MNDEAHNMLLRLQELLKAEAIEYLGGFENEVFRLCESGNAKVVRVTANSHRTELQLRAELDFVDYLADQDISVARPVPFPGGEMMVELDPMGGGESGDCAELRWVTLFEAAPGGPPLAEDLDDEKGALFERLGRLLAAMHTASRSYTPSSAHMVRHSWREDELVNFEKYIPAEDEGLLKACLEVRAKVDALPRDDSQFGLVHGDLHQGNFFVHDGEITAFDFDDCSYHWFASDIAMTLYYLRWPKAASSALVEGTQLAALRRGYETIRKFDERWLEWIPLFFALRDAVLLVSFLMRGSPDDLEESAKEIYDGRAARLTRSPDRALQ